MKHSCSSIVSIEMTYHEKQAHDQEAMPDS